MTRRSGLGLSVSCAIMVVASASLFAQQIVLVTIPAAVGFDVVDVAASTPGTTTTHASFTIVNLLPWNAVRVSVRADSDFSSPGGPQIPAANVSWTTSNASGGTGLNGSLSTTAYAPVLQTQVGLLGTGKVDIDWTLAPPPAGVHGGSHALTVRWRLEAVIP